MPAPVPELLSAPVAEPVPVVLLVPAPVPVPVPVVLVPEPVQCEAWDHGSPALYRLMDMAIALTEAGQLATPRNLGAAARNVGAVTGLDQHDDPKT